MKKEHALKIIEIARNRIKPIEDEIKSLENDLLNVQKENDSNDIKYSITLDNQISLLVKLKNANLQKISLLQDSIK